MKKKLKNSFYYKAFKLSILNEMSMKDMIQIIRSGSEMKMQFRVANKPNKTYEGEPEPFFNSFVNIPVINKRTNKILYYKLEKIENKD